MNERQNTILRAGRKISYLEEEKELVKQRKSTSRFKGIIPLKSRIGTYYFIHLNDDVIGRHLFLFGAFGYERTSAALFTHLSKEAAAVIDIGAYSGYYTILASVLAGNKKVISIEANPFNYHRLQENLSINGSNAEIKNVAIIPSSDRSDSIRINYDAAIGILDTGSYASHQNTELIPQKISKLDWFTVPATNILELMTAANIKPISLLKNQTFYLIKLDVEGLESSIFEDICKYFSGANFLVVIEILTQNTFAEICRAMAEYTDLAMVYVSENEQTLTIVNDDKLTRTQGSRNFIIGRTSHINEILSISIPNLLSELEP